jgi:NAD-dependent DNA ligase
MNTDQSVWSQGKIWRCPQEIGFCLAVIADPPGFLPSARKAASVGCLTARRGCLSGDKGPSQPRGSGVLPYEHAAYARMAAESPVCPHYMLIKLQAAVPRHLTNNGGPFAPSSPLRQFLDLPSAHSAAEVAAWRASVFDRISDVAQQSVSFTFEPQLAGVNIGLRYENGQLCLAVVEGEAVFGPGDLASLAAIQNLPIRLSGRGIPKIIEVHACLFVPRSALSAALRSHALEALRALRNRQAAVELKCLAHEMAYSSEPVANTHFETMQCLDRWGFEVSSRLAISEEAVREDRAFHQLCQDRASVEFPVVGRISRLNYFHLRKRLASGARPLPWAVARPFRLADL